MTHPNTQGSSSNSMSNPATEAPVANINPESETLVEAHCAILAGNVETLDQGCLSGWVQDTLEPDRRVVVSVFDGNKHVGQATADQFRGDLSETGIGDGRYGFSVPLHRSVFDGCSHELRIVDAENGAILGDFDVLARPVARSAIREMNAGCVYGVVELEQANGPEGFDIELLVDGVVAAESVCLLDEGSGHYQFEVRVPKQYFDDCLHAFSVRLKSLHTVHDPILSRIASITTPWEHLKSGSGSRTLSSMSGVARYRYSALRSQLSALASAKVEEGELANIMLAHDLVVEGYEGRRTFPRLTLPTCESPKISIIIPVHNKFELTYHCVASLILAQNNCSYEVIVVDDMSSDETTEIENYIDNVSVVRNEKNQGFLLTATAGAEIAQGEKIVFLNNDTEVTEGWLDRLCEVFERFPNAGMAGSKLIYPTGRLQEAGGIVWENGKPWNVGNGENAEDPRFNYSRRVDYVSGAALMIDAALWKAIGGFDKSLVPAYYEDTDLAFKVRDAGRDVWYCPSSVVVHFEGMSNGRELNAGIKRFQSINAPKFRSKWRKHFRGNGIEGLGNLQRNMDRGIDFRALVIDHSTPQPNQDAGGYAVVQEMRLMQELGCKVTFAPNNMAHMGAATYELQELGVECLHAPFYSSVGEFLSARGSEFDLIYIIRYDVAEQVFPSARQFSRAKIVLNNCDLHFLRELRAAQQGVDCQDLPIATRERELAVMSAADAVLSYSEIEQSVIDSHNMDRQNVFVCPWILSPNRSTVPFARREGIAFLGGFNHTPNREGLTWFVENVMPLLRDALPGVKLSVYGSRVTSEIEALEEDDILIEGFVESLSEVFDTCRVFVAPLLSGAGIKGKVLESIAHGVPAVLSPVAAEATGLVDSVSTSIATSPEQWVEQIVSLHDGEEQWNAMSDAAHALAESRYGFDDGLKKMSEVFRYLELDPAAKLEVLHSRLP